MARVKAGEILAKAEALWPGSATAEELRHYLWQAEGFAAHAVGLATPPQPEAETELTVELPYEGLYLRYIEGQIHYLHGELSRYNSAMAAWNELLLAWRDHRARAGEAVAALKLC